jgi:hypothetical protein
LGYTLSTVTREQRPLRCLRLSSDKKVILKVRCLWGSRQVSKLPWEDRTDRCSTYPAASLHPFLQPRDTQGSCGLGLCCPISNMSVKRSQGLNVPQVASSTCHPEQTLPHVTWGWRRSCSPSKISGSPTMARFHGRSQAPSQWAGRCLTYLKMAP